MLLSDDDILERVDSPNNLINRLTVIKMRGTGSRGPATPMEIRKVVAVLANEGNKQADIADAFDITGSNTSLYANGRIGNSHGPKNEELKETIAKVNLKKVAVEDKAIDALLETLEIMKPQLADVTKPKVLSSIAKDMASVAKDMRGGRPEEEKNRNVHLHIYAPKMKELDDYEIIEG